MPFYLIYTIIFLLSGCTLNEAQTPIANNQLAITEKTTNSTPIKITYGEDPNQFGELRIPEGDSLYPVIVILHGGCWQSIYDKSLMDAMAEDLTNRGYATWNLEYRRIGNGGGWPNTFLDVATGFKKLTDLANTYPIDLQKILITGHSAGGHLALWLGAQNQLPDSSEIKTIDLPKIKGIVSLAGITDLETYLAPSGCGSSVDDLIGGSPNQFPERYFAGSPISFVPLCLPQVLINGEEDQIVPISHISPYYEMSVAAKDKIKLVTIPNAGHFEVITPGSNAWEAIIQAFADLL